MTKAIESARNIADLRVLARRNLPSPIFHFLEGGAEDEVTLARNTTGFEDFRLTPRCLVDVGAVDTRCTFLGQQVSWPLICAPTGTARFYHSDGEIGVARAAAASGAYYGLSTVATASVEAVAEANNGPKMFQLYVFKDRSLTRELIARCKAANYTALCLTVDTPVPGKRERDLRTGWGVPIRMTPGSFISFATHPAWLLGLLRKGSLSIPNLATLCGNPGIVAQTRFIGSQLDPTVSWGDVAEFIELWGGPFAIKGVMAASDARRAVEVGASAVIVSNHGGRQCDGAAGAVDVLASIVAAIAGNAEIILEGGIRRGSHIVKALALGATACSIGRPYLYGLAAGGFEGAFRALEILRTELVRTMQLCGCGSLADITPDLLQSLTLGEALKLDASKKT